MRVLDRIRYWVLIGGGLLLSAPALGQDKGERQPPYDVYGLPPEKVWVPWIFAFLFLVGCVLIALKNPRRSHLD